MNAIIALCHFCELHGPSILFCTQPFHCCNHSPDEILKGDEATPTTCGINYKKLNTDHPEKDEDNDSKEKLSEKKSTGSSKLSTCEACRSLQPEDPGFISIDKESHISYISLQHPEEQTLYSVLRHACVRSLSSEILPGREGPIFFGDEASGYVFSHTFVLKDLQSRGFQRWYSLICVMMDRIYLVNSWQFLISNFKNLIDELKGKAEQVYKTEQAEKPNKDTTVLHPRNNYSTDPFHRTRGGQAYRSLAVITKDQEIFQTLHTTFAWILKASGERFTEKVLVGPPVEEYLLDENNTNPTIRDQEIVELLQDHTQGGSVFESIMDLYKTLGDEDFHMLAYHIVRGDQLIVRGTNKRTVASTLEISKNFIPRGCVQGCQYFENEYWDSFRCNFLGLDEGVSIPDHVKTSGLYVLVDIIEDEKKSNKAVKSHFSQFDNSFDGITFRVEGVPLDKEPTYLKHLMQTLRNDTINKDVFDLMLVTLKERWMGKVKVMFKFSKTGMRSSEEKTKLLGILKATSNDEILLKYWMTSLSYSYRAHLLSASCEPKEET